jgi:hypothetical protein
LISGHSDVGGGERFKKECIEITNWN